MEYRERYVKSLSEKDLPIGTTESKFSSIDDRTKELHSIDSLLPWEIPSTDYPGMISTTHNNQQQLPINSTIEAESLSSFTIVDPLRLFETKRIAALARLAEKQRQKVIERSIPLINDDLPIESVDIASTSSSRIRPIINYSPDEES